MGTAGNISARLDDGYLITPTDACLGRLDPARLSKVNGAGEQVSGDRASKTIRLHRAIYDGGRDVGASCTRILRISSRCPCNRALMPPTCVPPLTPYHVMKAGRIPLIPYRRPGAPEVADIVTPFVKSCRGVMLARIGPTFWHESVSAAAAALEEAEETAKLVFLTRGPPCRLSMNGRSKNCEPVSRRAGRRTPCCSV